jgi:hypothetical protein
MIRTALRVAHALMALVFLRFAAWQFNDPDPIPWLAIYVVAAVLALSGALDRALRWQSAMVATFAFAWAMTLFPAVPKWIASGVRTEWSMKTGDAVEEEGRETGGLLIVTFWSVIVLASARKTT